MNKEIQARMRRCLGAHVNNKLDQLKRGVGLRGEGLGSGSGLLGAYGMLWDLERTMREAIKGAVQEHSRCTRLGAHHPPSGSPPASPAGGAAGPRPPTENALERRFRIQSFSDCRTETGCLYHISPKPPPQNPTRSMYGHRHEHREYRASR